MRIIEDHSPYYTIFEHPESNDIIRLAGSTEVRSWNRVLGFRHELLRLDLAHAILEKVPFAKELCLDVNRVSLFVSRPGIYYRAHKDGLDKRFGINYPLVVNDLTPTCWYDDSVEENYLIDTRIGTSRELSGFDKAKHVPAKTMFMQPDNPVLFNTDIYHDWDNRNSLGARVILTLRSTNNSIDFDTAKTILFK